MKKIHVLIAFFASTVFAQQQEIPQEGSYNSSVYLHPGTLISDLLEKILWLNLTGEMPLSGRYALVVPLTIYSGKVETEKYDPGKGFDIGSGIGIRRFVNGNADGLYLQLMSIVSYSKVEGLKKKNIEEISDIYNNILGYTDYSFINTDILGYIGYSIKFSRIYCFFDFGVGYGFSHFFSENKEIDGAPDVRVLGIGAKNGLSLDFNIGVGIPLF